MSIKVSIIIPCYNVEKYFDRCLQSVVEQTIKDIEVILVDDCSKDGTPSKCDVWEKKDSRISVIHKQVNEGLGYARNTGLEVAKGEYVAFLDSDDFVDADMYMDLYNHANDNNLDAVFCGYRYFRDAKHIRMRQEKNNDEIYNTKEGVNNVLLDMVGSTPNVKSDVVILSSVWKGIYRMSIFQDFKVRFVTEREYIAEDIIFHCDFLPKCSRVGFVHSCHYYYCENGSSLTKSYKEDRFQKELVMYDSIESRLIQSGFVESDYRNRLDRYFLLKIRACLSQHARYIKKYGYKIMRHRSYAIVNHECVRSLVQRFPYQKLDFKHKLFFVLLKYKLVDIILMLLK